MATAERTGAGRTVSRWLTTPQAAEHLGMSRRTFEGYRSKGGGPPFAKLGSCVRYRREDLDHWAESRIVRSTSEAK